MRKGVHAWMTKFQVKQKYGEEDGESIILSLEDSKDPGTVRAHPDDKSGKVGSHFLVSFDLEVKQYGCLTWRRWKRDPKNGWRDCTKLWMKIHPLRLLCPRSDREPRALPSLQGAKAKRAERAKEAKRSKAKRG